MAGPMNPTPEEHEQLQALLGAYALDAVEPAERERVEAHLAGCGRCRAEVADHLEVAAALAGGGSAPAELWDRIAGGLDQPADVPAPSIARARLARGDQPAAPPADAAAPRGRGRAAWAISAAAAVLVLVAVLGATIIRQGREIEDLASRVDEAPTSPDLRVAELESVEGELVVSAVISGDQGYVVADELPALPEGLTYQLWGVSDGRARSLGLLGADPGLSRFEVRAGVTTLAITPEEAPGAEQPTTDPVVAGDLV